MTNQQKTPLPGEWWETRSGVRVYVQSRYISGRILVNARDHGVSYCLLSGGNYYETIQHECDLTRHLPGCTGWDWEEQTNG